jgi:hypothetical protein
MGCSKLKEIADSVRPTMLARNTYIDTNFYDTNHPNATQAVGTNDPLNVKGKGTGIKYDTQNGGSFIDINGIPSVYNSGRKAIFSNTYNPNNTYNCTI